MTIINALKQGAVVLIALFSLSANSADVALIIDDIGYRQTDAAAFQLPSEVTFSILPHTPYSTEFAHRAAQQGREVMLHMPMEALAGNKLGPGALTTELTSPAIQQTLNHALASVPNAVGLNNHMGSRLTQMTRPMTATMEFLRQQQMFFIDSRTTRYSRAETIAQQTGLASARRHVFLDHYQDKRQIRFQFERLIRIAKKHQRAIGIAHPYPVTLEFLSEHLEELQARGIRLLPASELLSRYYRPEIARSAQFAEE
ncbi:uncharacterized protein HMF8227_02775 [Saliniradius amylolyticus]|uniref:Divergent polysaccharide deacetylase family protein n=1 Tax=Saliniradius amylolyticus TaxID=2183582 RepID=A0A2S2E6E1_9ALTE|nr:divergent polysaccharide deacetylase family protein [Saliniradius amylolyticus]AWL13226.1 uncharacterized protein HMF8227_02775 [Saliniradius amylolyticus]